MELAPPRWTSWQKEATSGSKSIRELETDGEAHLRIKESRLLIEFREHDSYINSDYDSDSDDDTGPPTPPLTNTLLTQARALVESVKSHGRLPNLPTPTIKYVLTRLEPTGHSDPRVSETLDMMRNMGIDIEFACDWHSTAPPTPPAAPDPIPAEDIVLDLSVLIALCCDSTHYPLPKDQDELERRFRAVQDDGSLARLTGASRDLRDQLRCEMQRPLILELRDRFAAARVTPRFWVTKEVRERLPNLVDVIGGQAERARARALFDPSSGNFWKGSRWEGKAGCLSDIRVRVLEDSGDGIVNGHAEPLAPSLRNPETPFDELAIHVCDVMLDSTNESPDPTPRSASPAIKEKPTPTPVKKPTRPPRPKRETQSRSPLRPGTVFPPASRLPSGHTLRTLVAGIGRRATVLTNNRGAVLKVLREAGVAEGIPVSSDHCGSDTPRARIWVVNPSSLAEWRRIEVEESNARRKEKGVASNGKENGVHEEETKESTQ